MGKYNTDIAPYREKEEVVLWEKNIVVKIDGCFYREKSLCKNW